MSKDYLLKAQELIHGDREQDYGHPKKNLSDIAALWTTYLDRKYYGMRDLTEEDVCWMMNLLKMARSFNGEKKDDTYIDAAGYIGLIGRLEE